MLATSYRGLKCFCVHISGGEAGRVGLHRFKTATVSLGVGGLMVKQFCDLVLTGTANIRQNLKSKV